MLFRPVVFGNQLRRTSPMQSSGALAPARRALLRSHTADPFDLRTAFAVERRLLPALLLLALLTAFSTIGAGADAVAIGWLALAAVNAAIRFLVATTHVDSAHRVDPSSSAGKTYLATALVDLLLWAGLFLLVPRPSVFLGGPGAFAAGS